MRDEEICRRKGIGIAPCVPLFYTVSQLRGIKETHNCTPYAKLGVVNPVKPS